MHIVERDNNGRSQKIHCITNQSPRLQSFCTNQSPLRDHLNSIPNRNQIIGKAFNNSCRFGRLSWRYIQSDQNSLLCLDDDGAISCLLSLDGTFVCGEGEILLLHEVYAFGLNCIRLGEASYDRFLFLCSGL